MKFLLALSGPEALHLDEAASRNSPTLHPMLLLQHRDPACKLRHWAFQYRIAFLIASYTPNRQLVTLRLEWSHREKGVS